jgi:hypothetical protein
MTKTTFQRITPALAGLAALAMPLAAAARTAAPSPDTLRAGLYAAQERLEAMRPALAADHHGNNGPHTAIERELARATLTDRDQMGFRMLLGRTAVEGRLMVDPDQSYVMGKLKPPRKKRSKKSNRTDEKTFYNKEATP